MFSIFNPRASTLVTIKPPHMKILTGNLDYLIIVALSLNVLPFCSVYSLKHRPWGCLWISESKIRNQHGIFYLNLRRAPKPSSSKCFFLILRFIYAFCHRKRNMLRQIFDICWRVNVCANKNTRNICESTRFRLLTKQSVKK